MSVDEYNYPGENPASPEHPMSVRLSDGTTFASQKISGIGAFGDVVVTELTPAVQRDFVYGEDLESTVESTDGLGAMSYSEGQAKASSGGVGSARLVTKRSVRYRPGQGSLFRFTGKFDTPSADSEQLVGAFSCSTNGLYFGYDGLEFGFLRRHSGGVEIQSLQITVGAGGTESVTITLNGVAKVVAVNAGTVQDVAQELAEASYPGWISEATDDAVHFTRHTADVMAGAFLISSTGTVAGAYTQEDIGVIPTDDWHRKSSWNRDKLDGAGPSGMLFDPTKLNVFMIPFKYLGAGGIHLYVEDQNSASFILVHVIPYANLNTIPSVTNPSFALGLSVVSGSLSKTVSSASLAGFVEGKIRLLGGPHSEIADGNVTVATPVVSIRNRSVHINGISKMNLRNIIAGSIAVYTSGSNKPIRAYAVLNGVLTAPRWVLHAADHTVVSVDMSATAIVGGEKMAIDSNGFLSLADQNISIAPGDTLSVVVEPTGTPADYVASISWREDL